MWRDIDSSETYIKMRIAAIPDLGMGTPCLQPFCAVPDIRSFIDKVGNVYVWVEGESNWCQLERQDQLQEMVLKDYLFDLASFIYEFERWCRQNWFWGHNSSNIFTSVYIGNNG